MGTVGRGAMAVAVAVLVAGGATLAGPVAAAAPTLTISSPSVAVGGTVEVTVTGCDTQEPDGGADPDVFPQVFLVSGTGADAVRAGLGVRTATNTYRITVPGWVDPAQPAVVAGGCDEHYWGHAPGKHWRRTFSYPDVPIDVTAGSPAPSPTFSVQRSEFSGGQVVEIAGSGCAPGDDTSVDLDPGTDLAWRNGPTEGFDPVITSGRAGADGTFAATIVLNVQGNVYEPGLPNDGSGPLPEGPYVVRAGCGDQGQFGGIAPLDARPQIITITATTASGSMRVAPAPDHLGQLAVTGAGCAGGRRVALSRLDRPFGHQVGSGTVTPDADGTWTFPMAFQPEDGSVRPPYVQADCGDPAASGFRYAPRTTIRLVPQVEVASLEPSQVAGGSDFVAVVAGRCQGDVDAVIADASGAVMATSAPIAGNGFENTYRLNLTAPAAAGDYLVAARCEGWDATPIDLAVAAAPSGEAVAATPVPGSANYTG